MERREFLTLPLAALAVPGLMAAGAGSAHAATAPARALKGASNGGSDALSFRQIKGLNADWYYTWQSTRTYTGTPFVPMIKDGRRLLEKDALGFVNRELGLTKTKNLLGFNEPDHPLQANMSVDEAVRLWPLLQTPAAVGISGHRRPNKPLAGPVHASRRENLRVDFMTMHCYAWPHSDSFLRKVAALHEKYQRRSGSRIRGR